MFKNSETLTIPGISFGKQAQGYCICQKITPLVFKCVYKCTKCNWLYYVFYYLFFLSFGMFFKHFAFGNISLETILQFCLCTFDVRETFFPKNVLFLNSHIDLLTSWMSLGKRVIASLCMNYRAKRVKWIFHRSHEWSSLIKVGFGKSSLRFKCTSSKIWRS